jgi:hypothetical protein
VLTQTDPSRRGDRVARVGMEIAAIFERNHCYRQAATVGFYTGVTYLTQSAASEAQSFAELVQAIPLPNSWVGCWLEQG